MTWEDAVRQACSELPTEAGELRTIVRYGSIYYGNHVPWVGAAIAVMHHLAPGMSESELESLARKFSHRDWCLFVEGLSYRDIEDAEKNDPTYHRWRYSWPLCVHWICYRNEAHLILTRARELMKGES